MAATSDWTIKSWVFTSNSYFKFYMKFFQLLHQNYNKKHIFKLIDLKYVGFKLSLLNLWYTEMPHCAMHSRAKSFEPIHMNSK